MSSSVAEGTTLRRRTGRGEKNAQSLWMAIASTFPIRVILRAVAHRAHVAERARGPFAFAPDSA